MNDGKLVIICILGVVGLIFLMSFTMFSFGGPRGFMTNEKDVLTHMGINVTESDTVPQGQTVRFKVLIVDSAPFNQFLLFIDRYKPTTIYYVDHKLNQIINYEGESLYFEHDGVIYLYQ